VSTVSFTVSVSARWEKLLRSLEASGGGEPEEWTALRASEAEKQDEAWRCAAVAPWRACVFRDKYENI
jgi:hypothetical protein